MSLWAFVKSVLLCSSVRNRMLPLYDTTHKQHAGEFFLSQSAQSSLSIFAHSFEPTEGLRHTEVTEAFQLRLAVTFCEIGWLNVSVKPYVFCSSVFFCEKKYVILLLSLCHSVLKEPPVSLCHYVILSKKPHLSPPVPLLFCLQDHPFCYLCPPVTLSSKLPCLPLSLCHYV